MKAKLPETSELLTNRKFWREEIFWQFAERCDEMIFENPQRGLEEARNALRLAELCAATSDCPGRLHVAAYSLIGSAHRACAQYDQAEVSYAQATEHGRDLAPLDLVDLKRRMAILRRDLNDYQGALELVNEAIRTYRNDGDVTETHFLGKCYQARGVIFLQRAWRLNRGHALSTRDLHQALVDLTKALYHLDPGDQPDRHYFAAVHNLSIVLLDCHDPAALGLALKHLTKAQKSLYYTRHHLAKYKLKWLKGLLENRFGSTRRGERLLLQARDGMRVLGAIYELAMISIDTTSLYLAEGQPAAVIRQMALETYAYFREVSCDEEALAALALWREAAEKEKLTDEIIKTVRQTIARLTKPAT